MNRKLISIIMALTMGPLTLTMPKAIMALTMARGQCEPKIYTDAQIANAIYRQENSVKYPYGIKSIDTRGNVVMARRICINTIRHARRRWLAAGMPGSFIHFLAQTYTTTEREAWIYNVESFLHKAIDK